MFFRLLSEKKKMWKGFIFNLKSFMLHFLFKKKTYNKNYKKKKWIKSMA